MPITARTQAPTSTEHRTNVHFFIPTMECKIRIKPLPHLHTLEWHMQTTASADAWQAPQE